MKDKYFILITVILSISTGCSVPKDLYTSWNRSQDFEGKKLPYSSTYISKDSTTEYSIWDYLMNWKNFDKDRYTDTTKNSQVRIEIINENSLKLIQINKNKELDTFILSGRFDHENFVSLQKHKKFLIPLIYYINLNEQLIFTLDEENNLIIRGLSWNEGALLFFMGDGGGTSQNRYKKI